MSIPATALDEETSHLVTTEENAGRTKDAPLERSILNKLNWHLMPLCGGLILIAYMDRGNVGYAASEMCRSLQLTHSEYGLGTSVFYIGYVTSQLGSNAMLKRFGAPVWLSFILFAWGCTAALMSLMQSSVHFFILRTLLGIAEGGTFPGVWYHLTLFYPDRYLGEPLSVTIAAIALAMPISAPLASGLLSLDGLFGIAGWRILFFVEGLIPILFSFILFGCLPASVQSARFLSAEEKGAIHSEHNRREWQSVNSNLRDDILQALKSRNFWLLTFGSGIFSGCMMILMYWMALIIQDMLHRSDDDDKNGDTCSSSGSSVIAVILTAIPDGIGGLMCLLFGRHQSKLRNRTLLCAAICVFSAFSLTSWVFTRHVSFVCGFLSLIGAVMFAKIPISFIVDATATLFRKSMRSTVVALFNSISSIGSFLLPLLVGVVLDAYGYPTAISLTGVAMVISACLLFAAKDPRQKPTLGDTNETHFERDLFSYNR